MGIIELFLTGVGLSMDAFAVAICKGLGMKKVNHAHAFLIALFFGGFQAMMPLIGWAMGKGFAKYIESIDHWIAFCLLLFIGGKMVIEAIIDKKTEEEVIKKDDILDIKELFLLAIATSIDALAVGIGFSFLGVNIFPAITVIGLTTFVISYSGVAIGNVFGMKFERGATIIGGVILIMLGCKILFEHLGIL
ncbi:MAG: manganese efflux pump MntP family protein [Lachnospiraceae bacterium]|nr:manganese efflux pump MntP family protein [Lachnospiraceae bacterium]